jgi:hypothetical protein
MRHIFWVYFTDNTTYIYPELANAKDANVVKKRMEQAFGLFPEMELEKIPSRMEDFYDVGVEIRIPASTVKSYYFHEVDVNHKNQIGAFGFEDIEVVGENARSDYNREKLRVTGRF